MDGLKMLERGGFWFAFFLIYNTENRHQINFSTGVFDEHFMIFICSGNLSFYLILGGVTLCDCHKKIL